MSHGPPPPSNIYTFGDAPIGPFQDLTALQYGQHKMAQGTQSQGDSMGLVDNSMFGDFEMYMNLAQVNEAHESQPLPNVPASTDQIPTTADTDDADADADEAEEAEVEDAAAESQDPSSIPHPPGTFITPFMKKKGWQQKVATGVKDYLFILGPNGRIKFASPLMTSLTGLEPEELHDTFFKDYMHPDDVGMFLAEVQEATASGQPMRIFHRLRDKEGSYKIFETIGHAHVATSKFNSESQVGQVTFCQALFLMTRPYPTKTTALLDAFLEHRIENERLKRRIDELKAEEKTDAEDAERQWLRSQEGKSDAGGDGATTVSSASATPLITGGNNDGGISSSETPGSALTRENLEGVGARADSIRDKMARLEGTTRAETIERLTGLRYGEGERSIGLTTGNHSPHLITGDAGIAIPIDRDGRSGEKKKKQKIIEEYVCMDCGTLDSPEWRKGPGGPKTLCNACGLRWAKKEKKEKKKQIPGNTVGDD